MNLLQSNAGRRLLFAALYFSEGAPIGYIWWALPTKLRAAGLSVEKTTAVTSLLVLPWALKFLWAPAIDTFRSNRWGRRAWIIATQLAMGAALAPLLWLKLADALTLVTTLLFIHALIAATQDAAVDALCVAAIPVESRGAVNGWMQTGMLMGRSIFGGGALYLESHIGPHNVVALMLLAIWSTTFLVAFATKPLPDEATSPLTTSNPTPKPRVFQLLKSAFASRVTWLALLFAATGGIAFEATGALAQSILFDLNIDTQTVGRFYALPVILAMSVGALLGGYLSDRLGRRRAVVVASATLTALIALFALTLRAPHPGATAIFTLLTAVNFLIGAFTATTYALFMDLTDPRVAATQFSAFMGATNLCESFSTFFAGYLAHNASYTIALLAAATAAIPTLILIPRLRKPWTLPENFIL